MKEHQTCQASCFLPWSFSWELFGVRVTSNLNPTAFEFVITSACVRDLQPLLAVLILMSLSFFIMTIFNQVHITRVTFSTAHQAR